MKMFQALPAYFGGKRKPGLMADVNLEKRFVAYLFFVGWDCISLGVSVCLSLPNIEIHLPFCFIRIGNHMTTGERQIGWSGVSRTFGIR